MFVMNLVCLNGAAMREAVEVRGFALWECDCSCQGSREAFLETHPSLSLCLVGH